MIKELLEKCTGFATSGGLVPFGDWLHYFAWDVIAAMTFTESFGFVRDGRDKEDLINNSISATRYLAVVGQIPFLDRLLGKNLVWPLGPPTLSTAAAFAKKQVDDRLASETTREDSKKIDFLGRFLSLPDSRHMVVSWLMRNVAAGSDSTAILLRSVLYFLSQHPQVQDKLAVELRECFGQGKYGERLNLRYRDLKQLVYLRAVINESLRMHPPVALGLEREVPAGGWKLPDGRYLPCGTLVGINPAIICQHVAIFGEDVDIFRPERWIESPGRYENGNVSGKRLQRMEKVLGFCFGHGKRRCPGRHVALMETYKVVVALIMRFKIHAQGQWSTRNAWFHYQTDFNVTMEMR